MQSKPNKRVLNGDTVQEAMVTCWMGTFGNRESYGERVLDTNYMFRSAARRLGHRHTKVSQILIKIIEINANINALVNDIASFSPCMFRSYGPSSDCLQINKWNTLLVNCRVRWIHFYNDKYRNDATKCKNWNKKECLASYVQGSHKNACRSSCKAVIKLIEIKT